VTRARLEALLSRRAGRDPLLRAVREAAGETACEVWLVGGLVRDTALGRPCHDIDLVARGRVADLVRDLQRRWHRRGFRFTKRGVTTWRWNVSGHPLDLVDATRRGLERDLLRREFSLNAVAFDLRTRSIVDPLRGLADLRARRLRLPRPGVLREDPVRALRAARFTAQLPDLRLHPAAVREARSVARGLRRTAPERVRQELDKLLAAQAPHRGLELLDTLGLTDAVLPELRPLRTCVAGEARPNVWRHTLDALELSAQAGRRRIPARRSLGQGDNRRILGWALLLHDISKPETLAHRDDGRPTFHGHEVRGARRADALLRRLRLPRSDRRRICRLIEHHLRPSHLADSGAPARGLRRLVRESGDDLPLLIVHAACDARASGSPDAAPRWRRLRTVLQQLLDLHQAATKRPATPLLTGNDVMQVREIAPGRQVGEILRESMDRQLAGEFSDRAQALAWLKRYEL